MAPFYPPSVHFSYLHKLKINYSQNCFSVNTFYLFNLDTELPYYNKTFGYS